MRSIESVMPESIVVLSIGSQIPTDDTTSDSSEIIRFPSMSVISLLPKHLSDKNGFTFFQNILLSVTFFLSKYA